jgi:hypothetical protein
MTEPSGGSPACFQFSIRLMLVATAAIAAASGAGHWLIWPRERRP